MPKIEALQCSRCGHTEDASQPRTLCPRCAGTYFVRYDLSPLKGSRPENVVHRNVDSMWRYQAVLPDVPPVTLGEGWTPMLPSRRNSNVLLKEEGANPTGTFKARGLSLAVTMAKHYAERGSGSSKLAVPSAGNAGGALAAYAAAAGMEAHVFMPQDVPMANQVECIAYGAKMTLVDGLISDCAKIVAQRKEAEGWFDVSTLKEPYRVEGKKTMGYELVEQLGWEYPDAVFYPTGGGVGLIGMWKAFAEMEELGWVHGKRPKMIAVQAAGCEPMTRAYRNGSDASQMFEGAQTLASGLRVPKPYGDYLILQAVRESGGVVISQTDEQMYASIADWGSHEGLLLSPEGAAATAAYDRLIDNGFLKASDRVVIFNTGAGNKYTDVIATMQRQHAASRETVAVPA